MRFLIILLFIGFLASMAAAYSVSDYSFLLESKAHPVKPSVQSTSSIASNPMSIGSGDASISQGEFLVILRGGRRYHFNEKKWMDFVPNGAYRENLLTSFIHNRNKVNASYAYRLRKEMQSK